MSLNLTQFHAVFFEESFESVAAIESGLLGMQTEAVDPETINTIFRAAHSIKGGAATFGFQQVASYTHVMENLLDQVRDGKRRLCQELVDVLLQSVDDLRELLSLAQAGQLMDEAQFSACKRGLDELLKGGPAAGGGARPGYVIPVANPVGADSASARPASSNPAVTGWRIVMNPHKEMLQRGNDPLRLIRELATLGPVRVECDATLLPDWENFEPLNSYLSWTVVLASGVAREAFEEVFAWVEDECDLAFIPLLAGSAVVASVAAGQQQTAAGQAAAPRPATPQPAAPQPAAPQPAAPQPAALHQGRGGGGDFATAGGGGTGALHQVASATSAATPTGGGVAEKATVGAAVVASPVAMAAGGASQEPTAVADAVPGESAVAPGNAAARQTRTPAAMPAEAQSIRVDLQKVDALINMVGELVITQSMLNVLSEDEQLQGMERLQQGLGQLQRQTRALQEGVMQIRMLPISFCFNRFPRMVRDLSRQLDKEIELILVGEATEVDKTVIEKIGDPLVHLVRNSVDHGIESRAERLARGKPEQGSVWLRAYHEVGNIIIEVEDDGKGLNAELLLAKARKKGLVGEKAQLTQAQIFDLIFAPGFSTKDEATDLSGRGVGMDVVKRNVQTLGGSIAIDSEFGRGTRITIRLPLTLAIMDGQLARVGEEVFVVPLVSIIESLQPEADMINVLAGSQETIKLRGQYLPVLRLGEAFGVPQQDEERNKPLTDGIVVIVEHEHRRFGIFLDDLLSQQQIVIKSLDENYHVVEGISAATILGDGRVALILDVPGLCQMQQKTEGYAHAG